MVINETSVSATVLNFWFLDDSDMIHYLHHATGGRNLVIISANRTSA